MGHTRILRVGIECSIRRRANAVLCMVAEAVRRSCCPRCHVCGLHLKPCALPGHDTCKVGDRNVDTEVPNCERLYGGIRYHSSSSRCFFCVVVVVVVVDAVLAH